GKPLLDGSAVGVTLQVGANSGETIELNFDSVDANTLGVDALQVGNHTEASTAIETIDDALDELMTQRATLGSTINRLDYTCSNLNTMLENITSAESRISDVDMADEMMTMTKFNILSQAANNM